MNRNAGHAIAKAISACLMLIAGFCGFLFYRTYLKWMTLFEDGRYFDADSGVVHHDSAFIWGPIALIFLLIGVSIWFVSNRINSTVRG